MKPEILYGYHPVLEAVRSGRRKLHEIGVVKTRGGARLESIGAAADAAGVRISVWPEAKLRSFAGTDRHQGIVLRAGPLPVDSDRDLFDRVARLSSPPPILVLDSIEDPNNLGAVIRTALCSGVEDVVIPKDRSASPTPSVSKASAGALEHIRLVRVTNLVKVLDTLKKMGMWIFGLDAAAAMPIFDCNLTGSSVMVIGSEEKGIRPLVKRHCDVLASIPQTKRLNSLNASAAAAVVLFERVRQTR